MRLKRAALSCLIGSVAISALLGISSLLSGEFGDIQAKVFFTSLLISAASILVTSCAVGWERRQLGPIPLIGAALTIASFGAIVFGIWLEISDEDFWRPVLTATFFSGATAHACVLAIARLSPGSRWAQWTGMACGTLLAGMLSITVWRELDDGWWLRAMGIVSVLVAATTIAVPLLHRINSLAGDGAPTEGSPRVRACPTCGSSLDEPPGKVLCASCGRRFRVEMLD